MIFPIFLGLPSYRQFITWLIVLLNVAFYFHFSKDEDAYGRKISALYEDSIFIQVQGQIFSQIIDRNPNETNDILEKISYSALKGDSKSQQTLGQLALRNTVFKKYAENFAFNGDQVQYKYWKKNYQEVLSLQKQDPSFWMGVSYGNNSWKSWISYQFLHGGLLHLISNMWFLLIFGCFLERLLGSFNFLSIYIFSGMFAAFLFQKLSGLSIAPLIGASGAISGIMGFVLTLYWNKSIRAFYWILPIEDYHGIKKIPSKLVFLMWVISDLTGYLSTIDELGGVAHAAHVGGYIFGISSAFIFIGYRKFKSFNVQTQV